MQNTFTPAICLPAKDGTEAEYSGTVTLRMPNYEERAALYDLMRPEDVDLGDGSAEAVEAAKRVVKKTAGKSIGPVVKRLPEFLVAVDITRKSDGHHFTSLAALEYDSDGFLVMQEAAARLVGKFSVGNASNS